ncbi:AraC family transcriptional regulator [Halodurantibacterium flavum]|uniref:AraC family transcriptional regulator n=1 Tax=Halodurantibacterium flavum TaxID=1382802 RepID=A0ABW4S0F8_9RHOB
MMTKIVHFTSSNVAPRNRLSYWNDICSDALEGTTVDSPVEGFRAEMWQLNLGALKLLRPRSDRSVVRRKGAASDGVLMHLQLRSSARFHAATLARRNAVEMKAGDFILSTAESGYSFELGPDHELIVVEVPRAALLSRVPEIEDHLGRPFSIATPGGRVFRDFLFTLWRQTEDELSNGSDSIYSEAITEVFSTLCALALAAGDFRTGPYEQHRGSALRKRCDAYIDAHLDDADLGTQALAREFGVSPRTVQSLFAGAGHTPTTYIQHRRLQRAADRLRAEPRRSITEIAFSLGFNDSAYFSRLFRRQLGLSPSEWRAKN